MLPSVVLLFYFLFFHVLPRVHPLCVIIVLCFFARLCHCAHCFLCYLVSVAFSYPIFLFICICSLLYYFYHICMIFCIVTIFLTSPCSRRIRLYIFCSLLFIFRFVSSFYFIMSFISSFMLLLIFPLFSYLLHCLSCLRLCDFLCSYVVCYYVFDYCCRLMSCLYFFSYCLRYSCTCCRSVCFFYFLFCVFIASSALLFFVYDKSLIVWYKCQIKYLDIHFHLNIEVTIVMTEGYDVIFVVTGATENK